MEQRHRFVSLALSGEFTVSELCDQFGVSRKTGHKWLRRYHAHGRAGLENRSRAPVRVPGRTRAEVERLIVRERERHATWGPKKIRQRLREQYGVGEPPATSTVGAVLKRHGLVKNRRRRVGAYKAEHHTLTRALRPNHVWAADFKGWFMLKDGTRCDPLTVSDLYSRYVLRAQAVPQATQYWTQRAFRSLFKRYGLPEIIRVDNGAPFATGALGGLSKLSVWWISLGIEVEFIRPGCPQDNGCHERMHRTMKQECCSPVSPNRNAQQQRFDRWRKEFNSARPHESLSQRYPGDLYRASQRRLGESIGLPLYAPGTMTRNVDGSGFISVEGVRHLVGEAYAGAKVALEHSAESGLTRVRYGNVRVGIIDPTPNARLRPPAYDERWMSRPCPQKETKLNGNV